MRIFLKLCVAFTFTGMLVVSAQDRYTEFFYDAGDKGSIVAEGNEENVGGIEDILIEEGDLFLEDTLTSETWDFIDPLYLSDSGVLKLILGTSDTVYSFNNDETLRINLQLPVEDQDAEVFKRAPLAVGGYLATGSYEKLMNGMKFFFTSAGFPGESTTELNILEVELDERGFVTALAIDFIQYEETGHSRDLDDIRNGVIGDGQAYGSYRFNSTIPVNETKELTLPIVVDVLEPIVEQPELSRDGYTGFYFAELDDSFELNVEPGDEVEDKVDTFWEFPDISHVEGASVVSAFVKQGDFPTYTIEAEMVNNDKVTVGEYFGFHFDINPEHIAGFNYDGGSRSSVFQFNILEVEYDIHGDIVSYAVDFQVRDYDLDILRAGEFPVDNEPEVFGSYRYNSSIPVNTSKILVNPAPIPKSEQDDASGGETAFYFKQISTVFGISPLNILASGDDFYWDFQRPEVFDPNASRLDVDVIGITSQDNLDFSLQPPNGEALAAGQVFVAVWDPVNNSHVGGFDALGSSGSITAEVNILEVVYDDIGNVTSLALDFIQYSPTLGNVMLDSIRQHDDVDKAFGSYRYNSTIPLNLTDELQIAVVEPELVQDHSTAFYFETLWGDNIIIEASSHLISLPSEDIFDDLDSSVDDPVLALPGGHTWAFPTPVSEIFSRDAFRAYINGPIGAYKIDLNTGQDADGSQKIRVGNYQTSNSFVPTSNVAFLWDGFYRGINTGAAEFNVLEVEYNEDGSFAAFAVDFIQYNDTTGTIDFDTLRNQIGAQSAGFGSYRYKSTIPINTRSELVDAEDLVTPQSAEALVIYEHTNGSTVPDFVAPGLSSSASLGGDLDGTISTAIDQLSVATGNNLPSEIAVGNWNHFFSYKVSSSGVPVEYGGIVIDAYAKDDDRKYFITYQEEGGIELSITDGFVNAGGSATAGTLDSFDFRNFTASSDVEFRVYWIGDAAKASLSRVYVNELRILNGDFVEPINSLEEWRLKNFGDAQNTGTGSDSSDADRDGISNLIEYATGTDPNSADGGQPLSLSLPINSDGEMELSFNRIADVNLDYMVEGSQALINGEWGGLMSTTGEANDTITIPESMWSAVVDPKFFRLRVEY